MYHSLQSQAIGMGVYETQEKAMALGNRYFLPFLSPNEKALVYMAWIVFPILSTIYNVTTYKRCYNVAYHSCTVGGRMESKRGAAHISYADGQVEVTSLYNADFVLELKSGLKSRRWNPNKKRWIVDIKERQKLLEIARRFYTVVEVNEFTETPIDAEPIEDPSGIAIKSFLKPGMQVEIWTDGACIGNPGPGGYAIIFKCRGQKWERAGSFRLTTNNRMEIIAALFALETLPDNCKPIIYTDSKYLSDSITQGWAKRWSLKGWKKKGNKEVPNRDLWKRMLELCDKHKPVVRWVKGHSSNVENERCDQLAESAARKHNLPVDEGYTGPEGEEMTPNPFVNPRLFQPDE